MNRTMKPGAVAWLVAALVCAAAALLHGCATPTAPYETAHAWTERANMGRVPHAYLWCIAHPIRPAQGNRPAGHAPRDAREWDDATHARAPFADVDTFYGDSAR